MDIKWAFEKFGSNAEKYEKFRRYYRGDQDNFFDKLSNEKLNSLVESMKDNLSKVVVDSMAARLRIKGFLEVNDEVGGFISNWINKNRLESVANLVQKEALICGDSYVFVWVDESGEPVIYHQKPENIALKYDEETGKVSMAVKSFKEENEEGKIITRVFIYTPDEILSMYYDGEDFSGKYEDLLPFGDDENSWRMVNIFGVVPIFHFYNGIRSDVFCESDLIPVVPLQDALNKELQARELASDIAAFGQKWATGLTIPVGSNGKQIEPFESAVQRLWFTQDENVRFGEFKPCDLSNYTSTINDLREEIARVARIPFHIIGISGRFPSGEALKTAEAPFVAKIAEKQLIFGDVWEDIFRFMLEIKNIDCDSQLCAVWENTQPHSEKEKWEVALLKIQTGMSVGDVLKEMGYASDVSQPVKEDTVSDTA